MYFYIGICSFWVVSYSMHRISIVITYPEYVHLVSFQILCVRIYPCQTPNPILNTDIFIITTQISPKYKQTINQVQNFSTFYPSFYSNLYNSCQICPKADFQFYLKIANKLIFWFDIPIADFASLPILTYEIWHRFHIQQYKNLSHLSH